MQAPTPDVRDRFRGCLLGLAAGDAVGTTVLGLDADTTAAVCGQVAGAYYGQSGIPQRWLEKLARREEITQLAERLFQNGRPP